MNPCCSYGTKNETTPSSLRGVTDLGAEWVPEEESGRGCTWSSPSPQREPGKSKDNMGFGVQEP